MSRKFWYALPAIGVCFSLFWLSDASSLQASSEPVQAEMAHSLEMPVDSMTPGAPQNPLGRNEVSSPGAVFADQRGLSKKYLYRAKFSGYADDVGATFPSAPGSNEFYDYIGEHAGTFLDPKPFTEPTWPGAVHRTTFEGQYVFLTSKISGVPDAATPYPQSLNSNEFWELELVTPQAGTFTDPKTLTGPTWPGAVHAYTEAGETWLATALQSGDPQVNNWPSPQTDTTHWTKIGIVRHKGTFADPKKLDEATTKGLVHSDVIDGKSVYYRSLVEGVPSQSNLAYPVPGSHNEFWEHLGTNYPEGTWAEPKGASGFTWPGRIHAVHVGSRLLYLMSKVDGLLKEHDWPFPDNGENAFWSVAGESRHAGNFSDPKGQQEVTWAGAIHIRQDTDAFSYYESLISANLAQDANAYPLPEGTQSNDWWRFIGSREHAGTMEDPHIGGFNAIGGVVRLGDVLELQFSDGRSWYYRALFSGDSQGTFPGYEEAKQYWAYIGQTSLPGTFETPNLADHMTRPGLIHRFEHEGKRHFVRSRTTGLPEPGGWRFPVPPESNEEWEYIETGEHDGTWDDPKIWSDISWPGAIYAYQGPSLTAGGPTRLFFKSRFLGKPADHSADFRDANAWEPLGGPAHAGTVEDPILYLRGMTFRGAIHFLPANGTHTVFRSRTNGPSNATQSEHWSFLGTHINEGTLETPKRWDEYTWPGRIHRAEGSDGKIRFFSALSSGVPALKPWVYPDDDSSNKYWSYIGTSEHAGTFEDPQQWSDMTWNGAIHRVERSGLGVYYSANFSGNAEQLNRPYPDKEEEEDDPYWNYEGTVRNPGTDQFPRTTAEPVWPGVLVKSGELYYVARNQGVPAKNDWPFPGINDSNDNWRYHGFSRNSGTENNPKDWAEVTWPGAVHQDPRADEQRLFVSKQSGVPSKRNWTYPPGSSDNNWWTFLKAEPAEGSFDNPLGWNALTSPGKIHSGSVASQTMYFASKFNGYAKPPGTPEEDEGKVYPDRAADNEWWTFMRKGNGKEHIPNVWNDYSLVGDINVYYHNGTRYLFRAKREGRPSSHNWDYPTGPVDNENWEYVSMHDGTLDDPKEWNELSRIDDVHRYEHGKDTFFFRAQKEGNPARQNWYFPTQPRDNDHWTYIGHHSGLWQDPKSWSEPTWPGAIHNYESLYFSSRVSGVPADRNWYYPTTPTSNEQWQYLDSAKYTAPGVNDLTRPFNKYTWATAHNAYNNEYEPQFNRGIRGFMIDIHWDGNDQNVKVCHSSNECNFTRPTLKDVLLEFYNLLERNRNAVITIIFESTVTHDQLRETLIETPQLSKYVSAGSYGDSWPTLQEMIDSNKRLVLFSDGKTSGTFSLNEENESPLNLYISPNISSHVENTYNLGTTIIDHDWSCGTRYDDISLALRKHNGTRERLFILNQFHDWGSSEAHAGDVDNNLTWLQRRVERHCGAATGWRQPNYLAIDFNQVGDAFPYAAALSQGGIYFYEQNNANRDGDTVCVLPANQHTPTNGVQYDIRLKSHGCENDEIRSMDLEGIRAGTRIQLWDSPDGDKQDDFTIIDIKQSIPMGKRVKIDSLEGSSDTFHYRKLAFRNSGLNGKVSRIVVSRTPPDEDISDAQIVFHEASNGSQNIVCTVPFDKSRQFKMGSGNNSFGCDNDEIRSGVVVKAGRGSIFSVHGNPNGSDSQGKAKVTFKRNILLPITLGSFNSSFENSDVKVEVTGGGDLDGKISYAYFTPDSQPDPEPVPDPGAPAAPGAVRFENQWHRPSNIIWNTSQYAVKYRVFKWSNPIAETTDTRFQVHSTDYARFHVRAVDSQGRMSPMSNYVFFFPDDTD